MSTVDLKAIVKEVEKFIKKKLDPAIQRQLKNNIVRIFRTKVSVDLAVALVQVYDALAAEENAQYGSAAQGKDPMSLDNLRPLFIDQIQAELSVTKIVGNSLIIEVGNKELWGYGSNERDEHPTSVDVLVYYIEGITGEFGFISKDHYRKRRPPSDNLGRFGEGFLISKERYAIEKWERVTGVSFEDIRHPISGQPPFKGFNDVANNFDYSSYVREAVEKTFKELPGLLGR